MKAKDRYKGQQAGGYVLDEIIGHGGMGIVCKAQAPDGSTVAVKLLHPQLTLIPEYVKRFQREARLAETLAHPNVVKVLDSGEDGGRYYMVMEYVDGYSLTELMRNAGIDTAGVKSSGSTDDPSDPSDPTDPSDTTDQKKIHALAPEQVIHIMRQIAGVLQAGNDLGLVHRDIKPDNILIDKAGNAKLLDFGLAKDMAAMTSFLSVTGQTIGTPPYMSPEQHEGLKEIDVRSDLYSLGATAYHLLTGKLPFPGPTASAFAHQHVHDVPDAPRRMNAEVPRNLSEVVERLLAKKPADRHQTPAELIEDLNRVERGEVPLKRYKPKRVRSHNPVWTFVSVAAAVAITLGAVGGWWFMQHRSFDTRYTQTVAEIQYLSDKQDFDRAFSMVNSLIGEATEKQDAPKVQELETLRDAVRTAANAYRAAEQEKELAEQRMAAERLKREREQQAAAAERQRQTDLQVALSNARRWMDSEDTVERAAEEVRKALTLAMNDELAEVETLMQQVEEKMATRRPWAAVIDFTVDTSVQRDITGSSVAVKLEQTMARWYRLLTRSQVRKALDELQFQNSDLADRSKAKKFGKMAGAEYLISGSVVQIGSEITIAAQIFNLETGAIRQTAEVSARDIDDFNSLFREIARILAMNNQEKQQYMDEKFNYPRHLADGRTAANRGDWAAAVRAYKMALTARRTSEAENLLREAEAKAEEQRLQQQRESAYRAAMAEGNRYLAAENWDKAENAFRKALDVTGYGADADALNGLRTAQGGEEMANKQRVALDVYTQVMRKGKSAFSEAKSSGLSDAQRRKACEQALVELGALQRTYKNSELGVSNVAPLEFLSSAQKNEWSGLREDVQDYMKRFGPSAGDEQIIDLGGGVRLELVWIPPGNFMMGSPSSEEDRDDDEDQHQVRISKGFWMGKYEVTQEQWERIMGDNPSRFKGSRNPVEQVSWDDCQGFIDKLNSRVTGGGFRLPTEAEWEYACRAGTTTAFHYGNSLNSEMANFDGNYPYKSSKGVYRERTTEAGSFRPNEWGLYDMHGNVWEWCADWYGSDYYKNSPRVDPKSPGSGENRVIRGGCWDNDARDCRSADRGRDRPDDRSYGLGFRIVRAEP